MPFLLYATGVVALISGLAWLATLAGLPPNFVSGGAMVLLGMSIVPAGLTALRAPAKPLRTLRSRRS